MISKDLNYQQQYSKYRKFYERNIKFLIKSKHASAYTIIILSFFTVAFFGAFAIRPTVKTIIELKKQLEDLSQVNQALQKKIDSLVVAQEEYQLIKDFVPAIEEALPEQPEIAQVLSKINSLASESQATVSALQVQSIVYKPMNNMKQEKADVLNSNMVAIDVDYSLNGSYTSLYSFLDKILKMRRTVTTQSITLQPLGSFATLKLSLKINAYYLKNE